jgi:hypothetical protein
MLKILKVAAAVGVLAWASPERDPASIDAPALGGRAAEGLWRSLPEEARERLLREAAREAIEPAIARTR